jgi:hypothetical protein
MQDANISILDEGYPELYEKYLMGMYLYMYDQSDQSSPL